MDKSGRITLWDFNTYYAGSRGSDTIYDVPNARTTDYEEDRYILLVQVHGAPRGTIPTHLARESQINIMASKAGIDPLEFRLKKPER